MPGRIKLRGIDARRARGNLNVRLSADIRERTNRVRGIPRLRASSGHRSALAGCRPANDVGRNCPRPQRQVERVDTVLCLYFVHSGSVFRCNRLAWR